MEAPESAAAALLAKFFRRWREGGLLAALAKTRVWFLKKNQNAAYRAHRWRNRLTKAERRRQEAESAVAGVKFSVITPLYNTPRKALKRMMRSVLAQTCGNWELCLADGSGEGHEYVGRICREAARKDPRVKYRRLEKNQGIAGNSNAALEIAGGEYAALLDHGDELHPAALYEAAKVIRETGAETVYTDEDKISAGGRRRFDPRFKPDFALDTLRSYNYIGHFLVFKRSLLERTGGFDPEYDGAQDYDLLLRMVEKTDKIAHVPKVLYHRRAAEAAAKESAAEEEARAVRAHLRRLGLEAEISPSKAGGGARRIAYTIQGKPLVSILIPNKDHAADLETCANSVLNKTAYANFEIIIIENNSVLDETFECYEQLKKRGVKIAAYEGGGAFNYADINNFGAKQAGGEYLVFLNNDVELLSPNWIEEMLMFCQRDDAGACGAKLYYPDGTIQHAGVILGLGGTAGHCFRGLPGNAGGYFGSLGIQRNVSAVTGACMMAKRRAFDEAGGFDSAFASDFNDIDLCLKLRRLGYAVIWTPFAQASHRDGASRGRAVEPPKPGSQAHAEAALFRKRWQAELDCGDPFYNKNLSLSREIDAFQLYVH
jgi:GT2 family glycosyltransferase